MSTSELACVIGEIQLADVVVEDDFRVLWEVLAGDGLVLHTRPRDFAPLHRGCSRMLNAAHLPATLQESAIRLLAASQGAHNRRNELVHDVWIKNHETDKWHSGVQARRSAIQTGRTPREQLPSAVAVDLDDFRSCLSTLQRMHWRVSSLVVLASDSLTRDDSRWVSDDLDLDMALVNDDFSMSEDGTVVTVPASN